MATLVVPGLWNDVWSRADEAAPTIEQHSFEPLVIDVESAPWYEWCLLEGIGESRGRRLAEFVAENRPLESVEQLKKVPGLPSGWLDAAGRFLYFRGEPVQPTRVTEEESACD